MRKTTKSKIGKGKIFKKSLTVLLVAVMLVQSFAFGTAAVADAIGLSYGSLGESSLKPGGVGSFASDEISEQLRQDFLKYVRDDLVMRVSEFELSGPVNVIITFSDTPLIEAYSTSKYKDRVSYSEFRTGSAARKYSEKLEANRNEVLGRLEDEELVFNVKHTYEHMLDGALVETTYEDIAAICEIPGVERVMISNKYEMLTAVENPVDVYGTGIFNSGSVSYTGKGTLVAILDSGCDYAHSAFTTYSVADPLYDRADIEALLGETEAAKLTPGLEAREVYYGNITGNKIAFGYDYADKDPDVMPFESSHGTHVAGIIAGKDDTITGVAIDAQIAVMKVFSDYDDGADEGDILAALEDSVILGVDAINMSLGSSCGFTLEADPDKQVKNEIYSRIEEAGISLVVAASNDYSSAFGSEDGNTNKVTNPDSGTLGSPATYTGSMAVASISGQKDNYMFANGDHVVFFTKSVNTAAKEYDFFGMLGITEGQSATYEYVTIPGVGMPINYAGLDVNGKIALVQRGDISFEEKVQYAAEAGAVAVIIYNNVYGGISMTIGNDARIPAVSIGRDDGEILASRESGTFEFDLKNVAGPFMSDFSSWGPNPDLTLKPEITAHGGNITSAVIGGEYDEQSGTSMAAPNMCGITVLIRQFVKENYPELNASEVRDLVNQLCMSTATIALDNKGNPYSPRKQGAGIADIAKATTTPAYLFVEGIGKTKLELGDDPTRTGVYEMTVSLKNVSDKAVSYKVGNITMTESISSAEPEYVAEISYLLSNSAEYKVEGGAFENGVITVEAGKTARVTAKLSLSAEDKSYLNSTFENGMYVEGFLTFDNIEEKGVDLNAPFLAFYGSWGEAPIFDLDYYEVETEAHNGAIDDDDKIKADYFATTPLGAYYYDYMIPLGSYVYKMDESEYDPIPATRERAAVSYYANCISGIYGVYAGLLRGAKELEIKVVNTTTGEVVFEETQYNCYKAHYGGGPMGYMAKLDLATANYETGEVIGYNNSKFEVTMSAKLDWAGGENKSDTYSFSFYVDYQAPTITDATYRTEYDKSREENRYYVDLMVYDNHYAMSCRPIVIYDILKEAEGDVEKTYSSLCENPIPIYQENRGEVTKVTVEITDYLDLIADSSMPNGITFYIDDYAMNSSIHYVPFPETDSEDLEFAESELDLLVGETADLTQLFVHKDTATPVETDYLKTLKWFSSDESIVAIHHGEIEAKAPGTVEISVTSDSWVDKQTVSGLPVNIPRYKKIIITVSEDVNGEMVNNPDSSANVQIEDLKFASYKTLFAFNGDIDWSEIGETDSIHFFEGSPSVSFYPSEKIQLNPELKPWNIDEDRYEFTWTSSNPKVATVDENGVVTAESEGRARITLQIKIDGKTSLLAARLSVEVKSEFIIENRTLVAYKGKGGEVVIPDDEGIIYIGSFAFCHYDLDNEKEVEKDENGYYDMDLKKEPLGNNTVTSVVIPDGVETVQKYAFYNCKLLSSVELPSTCKTIEEYAFADCEVLKNVNFDHVKVIQDYAFYNCESLSCEEIGGPRMEGVYAIGDRAFANTRLKSVKLLGLSRIGVGSFENCAKLESVELGQRTRVAEAMFKNTAVKEITVYGDTVAAEAFADCKSLTKVVFKNDLTYLGEYALAGCKLLSEVTFEKNLEKIGNGAFSLCNSLKSIALPGCTLSDSNGAVYSEDGKELVLVLPAKCPDNFTVPKTVETVGDGAFSSVRSLKKLYFESGSVLNTIGDYAFAECSALTTVELPEKAIVIGDLAFTDAVKLASIDLSRVTHVGELAFANTAIVNADLSANGVYIGELAFYSCTKLKNVTVGAGAYVGERAFEASDTQGSRLESVNFLGDADIATAAFFGCTALESVSLEKVTAIGDYAFYGCVSIPKINAPALKKIGQSAFSDCYAIEDINAPVLEDLGESAFAPLSEQAGYANLVTELSLPSIKTVGANAFYGMIYLESMDISGATTVGEAAFGACFSLKSAVLPATLTEIPAYLFYNCTLLELDESILSSAVSIGTGAFYGVKLPADLVLPNVEYIAEMAFIEAESGNYLETVYAPKATFIGTQAFAGCAKLREASFPALKEVEYAAFAGTAIEEFEITASLEYPDMGLFESSESFKAFYAKENGEKTYNASFDNVMIKDGVLYTVLGDGYELTIYPAAKADEKYTVADGTTFIAFGAAMGNKNLKEITLPASVESIGNFAFYGCTALERVVFRSYYAPVLEGTLTGETIKITPDNVQDYPGFEALYAYDYYYVSNHEVAMPLYYSTFKGVVGSKDAVGLTAVLPDNCEGYDDLVYSVYFDIAEETSGVTAGKFALAFIDAVARLPEKTDRFDALLVEAAIGAYNALESHTDEKPFVDAAVYTKYEKACFDYNVDVVRNKIAHLFDMDLTKYSFELVKDAKEAYNALSDAERAAVVNSSRLDEKISELNTLYGKEIDFSKSYEENLPEQEGPEAPEPPADDDHGPKTWVIVLIAVGGVLVLAGAAAATIILIRKKRSTK